MSFTLEALKSAERPFVLYVQYQSTFEEVLKYRYESTMYVQYQSTDEPGRKVLLKSTSVPTKKYFRMVPDREYVRTFQKYLGTAKKVLSYGPRPGQTFVLFRSTFVWSQTGTDFRTFQKYFRMVRYRDKLSSVRTPPERASPVGCPGWQPIPGLPPFCPRPGAKVNHFLSRSQ